MAAEEKHLYQGGSSNILFTDRRQFYLPDSYTKELYADVTPFLTMSANMRQLTNLDDPKFKMFEHKSKWRRQYIQVNDSGDVVSAADDAEDAVVISPTTSVGMPATFTSAIRNFKCNVFASDTPGAVGGKPTGACLGTVLITTFTNATTVSVKNLKGASVTIPRYGFLEVVGTNFGEGSSAPDASHDDLSIVWNQCGIHRTAVKITDILKKAKLRGYANEFNRLVKEKGMEHKIQLERDLLFSTSVLGTNLSGTDTFTDGTRTDADGNVIRSTYGAFQSVMDYGVTDVTNDDQNIFDVPEANYTYNQFVDQSERLFRHSRTKVETLFSSNRFLAYWSKLSGVDGSGISGKSKWRVGLSDMKKGKIGFNYRELETPFGMYNLVLMPSLTESPYSSYAFAPSMEDVFHAVWEKPRYEVDIKKDNNPLYQKDEYISQEGIGMQQLPKQKILRLV